MVLPALLCFMALLHPMVQPRPIYLTDKLFVEEYTWYYNICKYQTDRDGNIIGSCDSIGIYEMHFVCDNSKSASFPLFYHDEEVGPIISDIYRMKWFPHVGEYGDIVIGDCYLFETGLGLYTETIPPDTLHYASRLFPRNKEVSHTWRIHIDIRMTVTDIGKKVIQDKTYETITVRERAPMRYTEYIWAYEYGLIEYSHMQEERGKYYLYMYKNK